MKCLILASGQGVRLKNKGDLKPLVPLLGLPLIERVILTAHKAGLTDFYVVTGYNGKKINKHLEQFSRTRNIKITTINNNDWKKENGISVLKAKEHIKENFVLLMSDHIFDESILIKLKDQKMADDEIMLAVDYNIKDNKFVDDVTKVNVQNNNIADIGKNISEHNAYDTGIFLCSPTLFDAIEESSQKGDSSLSGGIRILANKQKAKTFNIKDSYWIDVDNEDMFKKAENKLLTNLKKTSDGPVSRYLNRPISIKISKYLSKTNIKPDTISYVTFIIALLSAIFFSFGTPVFNFIAGLVAQFTSVLDGCDGEIARLKFSGSYYGDFLDAAIDNFSNTVIIFGMSYGYWLLNNNVGVWIIAFFTLFGMFWESYFVNKFENSTKKSYRSFRWIKRDLLTFIIMLGGIFNHVLFALLVLAVLTNFELFRRFIFLKST